MRRGSAWVGGAVFTASVLALAACSRPASDSTPKGNGRLRVALLTPGPVSDAGWNALAYEALQAVGRELDAETAHMQTTTPAEFVEGFRDFARRGYDLVIGHGFEFQDAARAVAPDYPQTVFLTTSGNLAGPNVGSFRFLLEEATYLCGLLAASLSRTGVAGAVGGMEIPSVRSTIRAFVEGATRTRPGFRVLTSYIGNWEDVGAAKTAAAALIQQGADVLFHNADAAGLGVLQAAEERHLLAFGTNKDQNAVAPDAVVASAVIDMSRAFLAVARDVAARRFRGRQLRLGMRDGVVRLVLNPRLVDRLSPEVRARLEAARNGIVTGRIQVPMERF